MVSQKPPKKNPSVFLKQDFYRPDALPVYQPSKKKGIFQGTKPIKFLIDFV